MSNENKKAWTGIIIPVLYVILLLNFPGISNSIFVFMISWVAVAVIQLNLYRFLNNKFPASEDLKD
ncbi:hypothetical protein WN59_04490 [Salinicoccus sediminis]|uniref:Uncharacterized protein n=1 Tax=Salinicoccus sediminis TaxID=1432562 RepID=A0A0M2SPR4_9STAP|nr:hypothetical protein [Salinicoccus sediminis]KKK34917.1 hypothetical protein WN59_04490 [Salinicoccus sediminis]